MFNDDSINSNDIIDIIVVITATTTTINKHNNNNSSKNTILLSNLQHADLGEAGKQHTHTTYQTSLRANQKTSETVELQPLETRNRKSTTPQRSSRLRCGRAVLITYP